MWREDRTPRVRLTANPDYWNTDRGPHLKEVVFRNDLPPDRALDLVCGAVGEVDILTEVRPADAARVEASPHARLVSIDAVRAVFGVINRSAAGLPLADPRARQALNLAVDRDRLVKGALSGRADPLAGLTPPSGGSLLSPYPHDPRRAAELWRAAGGGSARPVRFAALGDRWELPARTAAADIGAALGVATEVTVHRGEAEREARRRLAEKDRPPDWDVLVLMHGPQAADAAPLELHRAVAGATGEYRAGPPVPGFEALFAELVRETSPAGLAAIAARIDELVYDESLALFLCAPHALYAVNREVEFTPYRTTFELAECRAGRGHWSRLGTGG